MQQLCESSDRTLRKPWGPYALVLTDPNDLRLVPRDHAAAREQGRRRSPPKRHRLFDDELGVSVEMQHEL